MPDMAGSTDVIALPPAPEPVRPRTVLIGASFATAAVVMAFIALFARYFDLRSSTRAMGQTWIEPGTIPLVPGGMMMFTLLMSCVTVLWAQFAIRDGDRAHAILALSLTGLFGAAVINQTAYLYTEMGLPIDDGPAALMIYVITGAHLVATAIGIVFLAVLAFRALAGQYTGRQNDGIVAAVIYWYALVAVYSVIWYGIYIVK